MEVCLCYYNNFNHPQGDSPISFCMKHVITVLNASIGLYSMWTNLSVEKGSFYCQTDKFAHQGTQ